jgi:hypothetical protein
MMNSLQTNLNLFFSRRVSGVAGEDWSKSRMPNEGLMPVVASETAEYGYEAENRYFVRAFLERRLPEINCYDGLEVTQLLMTAYQSAEEERTISFDPAAITNFVPAVAAWHLAALKVSGCRRPSAGDRNRSAIESSKSVAGGMVRTGQVALLITFPVRLPLILSAIPSGPAPPAAIRSALTSAQQRENGRQGISIVRDGDPPSNFILHAAQQPAVAPSPGKQG